MFRIFGPPGTGKTTKLLDMVDQHLQNGIPAQSIAFLAFTRKAAGEASERAAERFGLSVRDDLFYFRTLHSLTFHLLGLQEKDLMAPDHFTELSELIGYDLNIPKPTSMDGGNAGITDHPILSVINLARLKKVSLQEQYNLSRIGNTWMEVDYVARSYDEYKKQHTLYDYTDMLSLFVDRSDTICPEFEVVFLDEAQDLSPLQWDIAHALDKSAKRMYVAGDDDQAIYRWAGADVDHFITLPGGSEVLEQSYRIPQSVHHLAETIAKKIHNRFPKKYLPKDEIGTITRVFDTTEIDMSEGSWLVMGLAHYMLNNIAEQLKSSGYLFERNGWRSISKSLSTAINAWERVRHDQPITVGGAKALYKQMSVKQIARGKRDCFKGENEDLVTWDTLVADHGLLPEKEVPWMDALDRIPDADRAYVSAVLRRGEKLNDVPRIKLSTIHGTKGGEADNVVLVTDLTMAALENDDDDLHRLFYVAVTRTKQNLFLIEPDDYARSYPL
tara:strand:+ start:39095 stop:40594 length:1500 start_codon:yes stop_codon:yes gene_type:complete